MNTYQEVPMLLNDKKRYNCPNELYTVTPINIPQDTQSWCNLSFSFSGLQPLTNQTEEREWGSKQSDGWQDYTAKTCEQMQEFRRAGAAQDGDNSFP